MKPKQTKPIIIKDQMFDFHNDKDISKDINIYYHIAFTKARQSNKDFKPTKLLVYKQTNYIISVLGIITKYFKSSTTLNTILQSMPNNTNNIKLYPNIDLIVATCEHSVSITTNTTRYHLKQADNTMDIEYV